MKRGRWIWIALGALLLVAVVAANVMRGKSGKVEPVQLAKVRQEDITSRVRAPGKIEPRTQVKISADVPGKVTYLGVKEGDRVRAGQLMLSLDDTQYRAQAAQTRAAVASAQARVRESSTSLRVVEANWQRSKALFEQKLLSQAEWDQANQAHEQAQVALATANEEATRAKAALDAAADNLSKCRFVAPFDGVVSALNVEKGEIVVLGTMNNPGTQILVVSDMSRMLVRADVDETDIVEVTVGQPAKISIDAMPDTTFPGTVTEVGNTAKRSALGTSDSQTNFEVKVVFDGNVPEARPGMTADVDVETGVSPKATVVPIQCVVVRTERDLERATDRAKSRAERRKKTAPADTVGVKVKEFNGVFVVDDKTMVSRFVPVTTGRTSETMIEIHGDVKLGEQVVSGPYKALRELKPGSKVKLETAGKSRGKS